MALGSDEFYFMVGGVGLGVGVEEGEGDGGVVLFVVEVGEQFLVLEGWGG